MRAWRSRGAALTTVPTALAAPTQAEAAADRLAWDLLAEATRRRRRPSGGRIGWGARPSPVRERPIRDDAELVERIDALGADRAQVRPVVAEVEHDHELLTCNVWRRAAAKIRPGRDQVDPD